MGRRSIRGVRASASLKRVSRCGEKLTNIDGIRGVRASASLKQILHGRNGRENHRIRGVRASASLKLDRDPLLLGFGATYPRRTRLGLIEASRRPVTGVARIVVSEAYAPRPH